ncbi:MAG: ATP-grasp domain-containing protein [Bdellovibrionales bacterium]|nr:ATP-grasp domain-containing protein [Bdellovibrionales bacterium]
MFLDSLRTKFFPRRPKDVQLLICGIHSRSWREALAPEAQVWNVLRRSREIQVKSVRDADELEHGDPRYRTVVLPLMESHTERCLSLALGRFEMLIPDFTALSILRNKRKFAVYARLLGLQPLCPAWYDSAETVKFPCVLKRLNLNAGIGIQLVRSKRELAEILRTDLFVGHPYLLQEFLSSTTDFVLHGVCENGRLLWYRVYHYNLFDGDMIRKGQYSSRHISISSRQLSQLERFLVPLAYSGPCNIDFKVTADGDIKVMEINPRLGGSLMRPESVTDLGAALNCIVENARIENRSSLIDPRLIEALSAENLLTAY